MMEIIKIEKENISDIRNMWESLNSLHGELSTHFGDHFNSFTFDERLAQFEDRDFFAVFAARTEEGLIGYCIASVKNKIGEIGSIFTYPEHRNLGVGDSLMEKAESWLKSKDISKIMVSVAEGNESVFGFYNKRGFHHRFTVFERKA